MQKHLFYIYKLQSNELCSHNIGSQAKRQIKLAQIYYYNNDEMTTNEI